MKTMQLSVCRSDGWRNIVIALTDRVEAFERSRRISPIFRKKTARSRRVRSSRLHIHRSYETFFVRYGRARCSSFICSME